MLCTSRKDLFVTHFFCVASPSIFTLITLATLLKNALSFFLRQVILDAGAVDEGALAHRTHSIRAVATSAAFLRNWSVSKVLEAVTWTSNPVFASFYFRDISYTFPIRWIPVTLLGPLLWWAQF